MGIKIAHVTKRFGDFVAVDDVSIAVPEGSLTALLGPSGSGKSTLLRIIAGLERPDAGTVHIFEQDTTDLPPQRRGVGFVFQHYAAFRHMSVWNNIAFGLTVRKRPKEEIRRRVEELMHLVQLDGFERRYPSQLSGGQRQRMALARALAVEPRVLLLDEPFGALDAKVREELRAWLRRLHDEVHVTTMLVTHDQDEAMDVADTIVLMNRGRVEQIGTPTQLYDTPASEFAMSFLGRVNRLGKGLVRPHDVRIRLSSTDQTLPGEITRIVYLGFEVRVELLLPGGRELVAQMTRQEAQALELKPFQRVHILLEPPHLFPEPGAPTVSAGA